MSKIEKLYQLKKTIFSINDLRIIWEEQSPDALKSSAKYFVDTGKLHRLRRGIFALNKAYNTFELANKLITPSYISLETALQKHGIIFQFSSDINSMAEYSRTIDINKQIYKYHAVKSDILINPLGIVNEMNATMASPERAICDFVYLYGPSYFDNLRGLDKKLILKISKIYGKKSVEKIIIKLIEDL